MTKIKSDIYYKNIVSDWTTDSYNFWIQHILTLRAQLIIFDIF